MWSCATASSHIGHATVTRFFMLSSTSSTLDEGFSTLAGRFCPLTQPSILFFCLPAFCNPLNLLFAHLRLRNLLERAPTSLKMPSPPRITLPRSPIHRPLHKPKERSPTLARPTALPHMRAITINLVVKSVKNAHAIPTMIVNRIGKQEKPSPMPRAILTSRMPPGSRDEQVRVDRFVQQRIDHVRPWSEFKQRLGEFQPDPSVLVVVVLRVLY
jgi:hypothetical protein